MWRPPQKIKWKTKPGHWPERRRRRAARGCSVPSKRARSSWRPARGCRRWCRGAPPTRASSRRRARLVRALRRGPPGRARASKRRAFATCRAARCCASATTASFPASRGSSRRCAQASDGQTRLFIQLIDFLAIRRRPGAGEVLRAGSCAITDCAPRGAGRRGDHRRGDSRQHLAARRRTSALSAVLDAARTGGPAVRVSRACHRLAPAAHPRPAARAARPLRGRRARARRRRASTASNSTTRMRTRWRRSSRR